ncbi:MAG: DUF3043 domain-containing protein [Jatrophihabitantaceae bacterium]
MKLSKRRVEEEPAPAVEEPTGAGKGRPTPKRRETVGGKGPVTAPRTRKEAYARQKEISKAQRVARRTPATKMTVAQRRELMRQGDPSVLPRRDQGDTRKLARDYVDSHRMASNYLLVLFPLIIVGYLIPVLQLLVLVVFIGLLVEWFLVGRRIRALAVQRFGTAQGGAMTIGFYAGSRAYLPRRWRLPAPQRELGDDV